MLQYYSNNFFQILLYNFLIHGFQTDDFIKYVTSMFISYTIWMLISLMVKVNIKHNNKKNSSFNVIKCIFAFSVVCLPVIYAIFRSFCVLSQSSYDFINIVEY